MIKEKRKAKILIPCIIEEHLITHHKFPDEVMEIIKINIPDLHKAKSIKLLIEDGR